MESLSIEVNRHRSYAADQLLLVSTEDFYRIVRTRIFAAAEMQSLNIEDRWRDAIEEYGSDNDMDMITGCYESLLRDLVDAATTQVSVMPMIAPD